MKQVTIYTDGACSGNPGPGGWGAILRWNGMEKELSGGEAQTTNNRMELMGAIHGLEALNQPCAVEFYTDSQYITRALRDGWKTGKSGAGKRPTDPPCSTSTSGSGWTSASAATRCVCTGSRATPTIPSITAATPWPWRHGCSFDPPPGGDAPSGGFSRSRGGFSARMTKRNRRLRGRQGEIMAPQPTEW